MNVSIHICPIYSVLQFFTSKRFRSNTDISFGLLCPEIPFCGFARGLTNVKGQIHHNIIYKTTLTVGKIPLLLPTTAICFCVIYCDVYSFQSMPDYSPMSILCAINKVLCSSLKGSCIKSAEKQKWQQSRILFQIFLSLLLFHLFIYLFFC